VQLMIAQFAARAQSWSELILSLGRQEGPRHTLHRAKARHTSVLARASWQQSVVTDMHLHIWFPHFMKAFPFTAAAAWAACCAVCSSDATIMWEQPGQTPLTVRCRAGWWSCNIRYIRMRYFAACGMRAKWRCVGVGLLQASAVVWWLWSHLAGYVIFVILVRCL
jgi:hypothetical protein